jgi:serine/threonine protein kinase
VSLDGLVEVGHAAIDDGTGANSSVGRCFWCARSGTNASDMEELAVGMTFADHLILGVAGRGAMGMVFKARHLKLDREVALKVIAPELSEDREFRIRFQREYEAEVSIRHPNVVRVYGAGAKDGRLYVTMQYVDGSDLATLLGKGRKLEPRLAARLIAQVADALDAAHARGIVHRDVKPANVLIEGSGDDLRCILTDFGLMKNVNASTAPLTKAGSFLGSCDYAAPEQLLGEKIDARVDVYALGCMLYQAVTGQVPFPRPVSAATMLAHMDEPPPLVSEHAPEVPPALDDVIRTAMAKDPDERYPTAGALGRAALTATRS